MSLVDPALAYPIHPSFPLSKKDEPAGTSSIIAALKLQVHPEGGYFVETDRDARRVANPFHASYDSDMSAAALSPAGGHPMHRFAETTETADEAGVSATARWTDLTRSASTSIFYLLSEGRAFGRFHRNKGRTVHTLHKGRARYVIIHADEVAMGLRGKGEARVETYVVGQGVAGGERLQWVVEGGKYKASYLLPDGGEEGEGEGASAEGCLISETVIPGFEFADHDFLKPERLVELVGVERAAELAWLLTEDKA